VYDMDKTYIKKRFKMLKYMYNNLFVSNKRGESNGKTLAKRICA
jgi:hypothetical protein